MSNQPSPEFLKAEDLLQGGVWRESTLTIKDVYGKRQIKSADGEPIDHGVVSDAKTGKLLILKTTNDTLLKYALGTNSPAELPGRTITIYPAIGNWFGQKNATAIRIRVPKDKPQPFIKPQHLGKDITGTVQCNHRPAPVTPSDDYAAQIAATESQEQLSDLGQAISDDPDLTPDRKGELRKLFAARKGELSQ